MHPTASSFIDEVGTLPSLPVLYQELSRAVEDPNASIEAIGRIISRDLGLASRLLKLANSAFYGLPLPADTIEEAMQRLGLRQIRELALATTVIRLFDRVPSDLVSVESFWEHSVACGTACALLARELHDPTPERVFVGGLLHDVGRLIMYLKAPQQSAEIGHRCRLTGQLDHEAEREILGFDHADLGRELLLRWRLPSSLADMVGKHHQPGPSGECGSDEAIVHVGDFLTHALGFGCSGELFVSPLSAACWERCRLSDDRIESLLDELDRQQESLRDFLQP
ncbi:MAG TPA: HDOD domain-containing protein [Candidatus Paceibacterota bacterium]|nr:HDOD domain-containing protein [Verrucomicrobiota bacterium]HRY47690.1 HDOD domain-containing protein [Candidatus Paceibacterota bacterium]